MRSTRVRSADLAKLPIVMLGRAMNETGRARIPGLTLLTAQSPKPIASVQTPRPAGEPKREGSMVLASLSARACALVLAIGCLSQSAPAAARGAGRTGWTPMESWTLLKLYSGKTWQWKDGAAYFAPDGSFKAWSTSNHQRYEASGAWEVRADGVMCFIAPWQAVPAKPDATRPPKVETCFSHQVRGNAIAQRKLPDGTWYFFRHAEPAKTDEIFKLQRGDHTRLQG